MKSHNNLIKNIERLLGKDIVEDILILGILKDYRITGGKH